MKSRLFSPLYMFTIGLLLTLSSPVYAQSSQPSQQTQTTPDTVRFAIMELTPYGMINEEGTRSGYLYEVSNLILKTAGFPPHNTVLPIKRVIKGLMVGDFDCSIFAETPFAKDNFNLLEKIGKKLEVGVLPAKGIKLRSYEDLSNIKIALPLGISLSPKFDTDKDLEKISSAGYSQAVKMLSRGRVEAIGGALDSLRYSARQFGLDPDQVFDQAYLFVDLDMWLTCPNKKLAPESIERLRIAVRKLRKNGKILDIIDRYR